LRKNVGATAAARAREDFSPERQVSAVEAFYAKLVQQESLVA
jgi:hypothetical protein